MSFSPGFSVLVVQDAAKAVQQAAAKRTVKVLFITEFLIGACKVTKKQEAGQGFHPFFSKSRNNSPRKAGLSVFMLIFAIEIEKTRITYGNS
jgi:hypothetical protein